MLLSSGGKSLLTWKESCKVRCGWVAQQASERDGRNQGV